MSYAPRLKWQSFIRTEDGLLKDRIHSWSESSSPHDTEVEAFSEAVKLGHDVIVRVVVEMWVDEDTQHGEG